MLDNLKRFNHVKLKGKEGGLEGGGLGGGEGGRGGGGRGQGRRLSEGNGGSHTLHVIKAEEIHTYSTQKLLIFMVSSKNHLTSASADTATGQCPAFSGKNKDRNN